MAKKHRKKSPHHIRPQAKAPLRTFETILLIIVVTVIVVPGLFWGLHAVMRSKPRASSHIKTFRVVATIPHDSNAYTQGLLFHNGRLIESTGRYGQSSLREIEIPSGKILKRHDLGTQYFGEGIAIAEGRIVQLTWRSHTALVYDLDTFQEIETLDYDTEGWGLTASSKEFFMSDGTHTLAVRDIRTFELLRKIVVKSEGKTVSRLNELEWVEDEIWANVWKSDFIARIDPRDGTVTGWIDVRSLAEEVRRGAPSAEVLNGIAYDQEGKRVFITGKNWPMIYQVELE